MNKRIFLVLVVALLCLLTITVLAHSGRTDSSGGHWNRSTGEYHYHHGEPAHQHYQGVCPYSEEESTSDVHEYNNSSIIPSHLDTSLSPEATSESASKTTMMTLLRKTAKIITAVLGFLALMIYPVFAICVGIRDIRNDFSNIILIIIGIWMSIGFIYLFKDILI